MYTFLYFNAKSSERVRYFSIHKDDICNRNKIYSFILLLPCEIHDLKVSNH